MLNKISFPSIMPAQNYNVQKFLYPNLAPLKKDTVSFSGRAKLMSAGMADAPPEHMTRQIEANAEPARFYLETILEKYLKPITQKTFESDTREFPVLKYTTRTKSSTSIREKVVSKYTKIYGSEINQFANQAVDALLEHYPLKPEMARFMAIAASKRVIKYSHANGNLPPYQNAVFYLSGIIENLDKTNIMDFSGKSDEENKKIFTDIITELEKSSHANHCEDGAYIDPQTVRGVKHYANDIVGARIIMRESGPEYTEAVLSALNDAVKDGALKITSIENNTPAPDKLPEGKDLSDYAYATDIQLKKLANSANAPLITNRTKSGYMAIHINVDLSDDMLSSYNGVFNGYSGEIQIIGIDVLQLKEIEDLCYKLKDNKNAIHVSYKPFKEHFQKYYTDKTKDAFEDYTNALYLAQREIPPGNSSFKAFPSLKELGFEGKVPPELDFNYLRTLKSRCDIEYKRSCAQEDVKSSKSKSENERMKSIRQEGNIKTIKKLISYKIKQQY